MRGGLAPPGPPLLPCENHIERGQQMTTTHNGRTSQLLDRIDPVGLFGENDIVSTSVHGGAFADKK